VPAFRVFSDRLRGKSPLWAYLPRRTCRNMGRQMRPRLLLAIVLAASFACRRSQEAQGSAPKPDVAARTESPASGAPGFSDASRRGSPLPVCRAKSNPLSAAPAFYDNTQDVEALACAAQAAALMPDEPQAHSEKGAALAALGLFEEAQGAYSMA